MKVLHLLTSGGFGGIEVLCRDLAVYSPSENHFCFVFGEGKIYEQMKEQGKKVYSLHDNKKISCLKFYKLKNIAIPCDIVIVHHDDPFLELYYLALRYFFPNKKYISMVHHCYDPVADNLNYGLVKRNLKYFITSRMFKKSDVIVFVSEAGRTSYIKPYHLDEKKSCIIYNGIGDGFIEDGKCIKKDRSNTVKLLYIGRLVSLKGVDNLVEVLPKLINQYDIHTDIVGDGICRNDLEQKVAEYNIIDRVKFHGFKNDVRPYLEDADIFVYPSKTEIFGISLVEAMAYKCICVASNVGGIPEIISDGDNGFLNEENSVEGLKEAIVKAINVILDDERREHMMKQASITAEKYSITRTVSGLENLYQKLVEK